MKTSTLRSTLASLLPLLVVLASGIAHGPAQDGEPASASKAPADEQPIRIEFLEIVTSDMEATCAMLEELHGVTLGAPDAALGNARTAPLRGGGRISVRAPMRADEEPTVRPYVLVDDIEAAVTAAEASGGTIAMAATPLPGGGKFAIFFLGGIQHALWQH